MSDHAGIASTAEATEAGAHPLLQVDEVHVRFRVRKPHGFGHQMLHAVDGVSLQVQRGRTLGLVGESGCGKSTLGRAILGLQAPESGRVLFEGKDLVRMPESERRAYRREMQIVFQDPYSSLDPRMTIHDIVAEPLRIHGIYSAARVRHMMEVVGLATSMEVRRPDAFSGGQRQRVAIARALALQPKLLVLDESVSALDVSIRAQILNLLRQLQREFGLAYLFISHDLSVIRHMSHQVAVMYMGRIVESGTREQVFDSAAHPYTRSLLSDVPIDDPSLRAGSRRILLAGDPPDPLQLPSGCAFRSRCFKSRPECSVVTPELARRAGTAGQLSACHVPDEMPAH